MDSSNQKSYPRSEALIQDIIKNLRFSHCILSISHSDYRGVIGGTEKVMRAEQVLFEKARISHFHVFPIKNSANPWEHNQQVGVSVDGVRVCTCTVSQLATILEMLCSTTSVYPLACHLHHLLGSSFIGVDFLIRAFQPSVLRFYLHDYYSLCPQFNLLKEGTYCGAPPVGSATCADCSFGRERYSHIEAFRDLFTQHRFEYIAPSPVAAEIWAKASLYPHSHVRVIPHLEMYPSEFGEIAPVADDRKIRIAYVGYQSDLKGWQFWKRIACLLDKNEYSLFHIGAGEEEIPGVVHRSLPVEKGVEDPVVDAIRELGIDIVILWSLWPETFSFTLFESIAARCYVITSSSSGNIAKVVREKSAGLVFEDESGAISFLEEPSEVRKNIHFFKTDHKWIELRWNSLLSFETARSAPHISPLFLKNYDDILTDPRSRPYLFRLESDLRADSQLQETSSHLQHATEELAVQHILNSELERRIKSLESYNSDLIRDLEAIHSTILWKLVTKFHEVFIERGLPQHTKRRSLYDRWLTAGRRILDQKEFSK